MQANKIPQKWQQPLGDFFFSVWYKTSERFPVIYRHVADNADIITTERLDKSRDRHSDVLWEPEGSFYAKLKLQHYLTISYYQY